MDVFAKLVGCVFLSACATFPELDGTVPGHLEDAGFPKLIPVEPLLSAAATAQISDETETAIKARVARLRTRAVRLRGTVVDRGTRARMRAGVTGLIEE